MNNLYVTNTHVCLESIRHIHIDESIRSSYIDCQSFDYTELRP